MGGAWACPGPHPARTDHTRDGWRHYVFVQHNQGMKSTEVLNPRRRYWVQSVLGKTWG